MYIFPYRWAYFDRNHILEKDRDKQKRKLDLLEKKTDFDREVSERRINKLEKEIYDEMILHKRCDEKYMIKINELLKFKMDIINVYTKEFKMLSK